MLHLIVFLYIGALKHLISSSVPMPDLLHACELINCSRLPVLILVWLHLAQCLTAATAYQCSSTILMEEKADNDNPPTIQPTDESCASATTETAATPHHDCPDCASSGTASCPQGASSSFLSSSSSSSLMSRRPYFRTALARSVYSKILVDREFRQFDKTKVRMCVSM